MKKNILSILLLVSISVFSQKENLDFDINKSTLSEYIQNEKNFIGGKVLNEPVVVTFDELNQISYIRSDNNLPDIDLIVRYIFFKKDSLLLEVRYEWDIANHNEKLNNKKDLNFRKAMISFYSKLENSFNTNFGKSEIEGKLPKKINEKDDYCKTNIWRLKKTEVKLDLTMSNSYNKVKNIFPTHKLVLSYRASNLKNSSDYKDKALLRYKRNEIPNIKHPILGSPEPVYPNCENSKDKLSCMYDRIRELILKEVKSNNMFIKNDTLKVGFMVDINGKTEPWKHSIISNNKELEKIGLKVIENLPIMKPAYSKKSKQNVASGNSFYIIIKDNKIANKSKYK